MVFLLPVVLCAQTPDTTRSDPEKELEKTLEEATQDAEDSQLVDLLSALLENPLDLNAASVEELAQIPGITPIVAFNIVTTREKEPFRSVDELLRVEGMTVELFQRMRQFVSVRPPGSESFTFPVASFTFRSRTTRDLQDRRGFLDGTFKGSALKVYNRLSARSEPFGERSYAEMGLLTEKDAGETSLTNFTAGYVHLNLADYSTRILLGDFIVESAEGLVFWRSIGFSKGTEVISTVKKSGVGIRPYLSTDENWYYRGAAVQVDLQPFKLSAVYSSKPIHASINSSGVITSFYSSGLFRTESELQRKSSTHAKLIGGKVSVNPFSGLNIGASGYSASFDHEVSQSGLYGFRGKTASMGSIDFTLVQSRFSVFSEVARSHTKSIAAVGGVVTEPLRGIEFTVVGRSYPKDFISLYGYGFGESSSTQNESGAYVGGKFRVTSWLTLSSYFDQFVFPWSTNSAKLPSRGNDLLVYGELKLSNRVSMQLQYKHKNKPASELSSDLVGRSVSLLGERRQSNYRATVEFNSSIAFRSRTRIEVVNVNYLYNPLVERGFLAFQDIRIHPLPNLRIDARVIVFETDSFDSRVYEFETDFRGTFSNPALFGKGVRLYAMARYEISRSIDVWLKYSQTIKEAVKVISSGSSQIAGDLENRLSLQVDIVY